MAEYIEREKAKEMLVQDYAYAAAMLLEFVPAADVEAVRHGEWIPTYHTYYNRDGACQIADEWHCSECKTLGSPQWKRRPVCEAKMDGKGEGE